MKILSGVFAALALSGVVLAARSADACNGTSCQGRVLRLYADPNYTYIELTDKAAQAGTCTLYSGVYWRVSKTSPLEPRLYSTVLSAVTGGHDLLLRVTPGSGMCDVEYVVIYP